MNSSDPIDFDLQHPPDGVTFQRMGDAWKIVSTTRSVQGLFLIPFAILWNGMVWYGFIGQQIIHGVLSVVATLVSIPFILLGLVLGAFVLHFMCGKFVIEFDGQTGKIFNGVGRFGWTRQFDWSRVEAVEEFYCVPDSRGRDRIEVSFRTGFQRVRFGWSLSESRRRFVIHALRLLLSRRA